MKKKRIAISLPDEDLIFLDNVTKQKNITTSKYISSLLRKEHKKPIEQMPQGDYLRVNLQADDIKTAVTEASKRKLKVSEYIAYLIRRGDAVVQIKTQDLNDLAKAVDRLATQVNGIVAVILRDGGEGLDTDVKTIIKLMSEINDKCNNAYVSELADRKSISKEVLRKVKGKAGE